MTHRDPYPYYASLRAGAPLIHDKRLNLWIAARASVVAAVFDHPDCRVRPLSEPIPQALLGSPAGEVFGRLVRMNDGVVHRQGKGVLERALAQVPASRLRERAWHIAGKSLPASDDQDALNTWIFRTPVSVVADLLVLAAANRDPEANARPDEFLLDRSDRRVFSFSRGAHACPGQALAISIASAALARLFDARAEDYLRTLAWFYQASGNGRLPVFTVAKPI